MSEHEAIKRALQVNKPKLPPRSYSALDKTFSLSDGTTARVRSTSEPDDVRKAFDMLSQAAENGETFAIDEFPTLNVFKDSFLHGSQLILIDIGENLNVGVAGLGESRMRRYKGAQNALIYMYMPSRLHRRKGYGKCILTQLEDHAINCGFSACLIDALVTKDLPYKFLRDCGYTMTGSVPLSGYVKGQGWTDALLFYKHFTNNLYVHFSKL